MDDDDRAIAALFAHPPLADDGFSERVMRRVRRRERVRATVLPLAAVAGAAFAFKPLLSLSTSFALMLQSLLAGAAESATVAPVLPVVAGWLPWAVLALALGATGIRLLED